ncbi:unnamed protein product [Kluyveromyces dobzhanskii CBS 2104]|uniref:mRNA 3'-end-processing protein RNA14 n=1 Tax=Kluyveromyces dobzhanskii CBS 2104 TaxID=1427455 RepID=A0A0A8LC71_9SACH|nr:unnamed protein product [Kluyveromyces dobzhanskii CBS 2104]
MSEGTATPDPLSTSSSTTTSIRPTSRVRDTNDVVGKLGDQIEEQPTDIYLYIQQLKHHASSKDWKLVDETFDKLHDRFPLMANIWCMRLSLEFDKTQELDPIVIEPILARCLSKELGNNDLSLWLSYITYVRKRNDIITGGEEARNVVIQAFQVVVDKCAIFEPKSSQFWYEYLHFLEHWKPINKFEEQQRIQHIRKLYKTLLCQPVDCLEPMWDRYTQWEQDVNQLTARRFIGELSAQYMNARSLYQDWSNITRGLKRTLPISLNQATESNLPKPNQYDVSQLQIWLDWIKWESDNKLELSEDLFKMRMLYVYMQAVQHVCFSPEIWFNLAIYKGETIGDSAAATKFLKLGQQYIPNSAVLALKLSEEYEISTSIPEIETTILSCIERIHLDLAICMEDDPTNEHAINLLKSKLTYVYCVYMNTLKRLQGLAASRKIFGKCRRLKKLVTYDIYLENAYIEYHSNKDTKTACKVLELGLKYFANDGEYINKYLEFLIYVNEESQIKSLFESSIDKITDSGYLKLIFQKVICYESKVGSLNSVRSLERRFFERFPDANRLVEFTNKYKMLDVNYLKRLELDYMVQDFIPEALSFDRASNGLKRTIRSDDEGQSAKKFKASDDPIPPEVVELLKALPKRQYFKVTIFEPHAFADFLSNKVSIQ